jgi:cobalt/nickel transport system permease protein
MHMSDALLSPEVGATFWAGTLSTIAWCSKKLRERIDEKLVPLMGVLGAFIFAAQMINFTIPGTGSSGHLGGGMILAIILGPYAAFLTIASVLTVQALFFADGGLLALGCNIWNLGLYPCFIAYPLIFKPIAGSTLSGRRLTIASLVSVIAGLQMGAFSVVLQTILSGRSELPFGLFLMMMLPIHLAIGVVEALVTSGIVSYVRSVKPEIVESAMAARPLSGQLTIRNMVVSFLLLAFVTGGALAWFASAYPDGLEWSIEKIYGKPELPETETGVTEPLKQIQEKTAFLPDYSFKQKEGAGEKEGVKDPENTWPSFDPGTSVAGIVGSVIVLAVVFLLGSAIRAIRKRKVD